MSSDDVAGLRAKFTLVALVVGFLGWLAGAGPWLLLIGAGVALGAKSILSPFSG